MKSESCLGSRSIAQQLEEQSFATPQKGKQYFIFTPDHTHIFVLKWSGEVHFYIAVFDKCIDSCANPFD